MPNLTFCEGREHKTTTFFFFLNFDTVFKSSTPERRIRRDRISAIKFEAVRLHFLSAVFVTVAVIVA